MAWGDMVGSIQMRGNIHPGVYLRSPDASCWKSAISRANKDVRNGIGN